jgi:hypothetical protein
MTKNHSNAEGEWSARREVLQDDQDSEAAFRFITTLKINAPAPKKEDLNL